VWALDVNGHKVRELPRGQSDALKLDLLEDCMYYIISK